ncbi:Metallo-dependent phosphatase [Punctularia strigosozonata HHB-11173 SS5]|uniref:Metallo-dependent phosphatase n=1 Tax=Punctularia strigosozonata (strain HHB-11173) TaxID=741275 RepID=UPI00044177A5|nr:Metallo-dependent phosphatase [Punctularia strigosozonata HHB-11173 SS5]EIN10042.1 Metallo-dependent phosphatase [Punctularia strigosozonata HHB-11173 SS5]
MLNGSTVVSIPANDVHAHLDEYKLSGASCTDPTVGCVGGYARVKDKVDELRPGVKNSLLLDAGDEFQGTLFFSVLGAYPISETINQLGFDVFLNNLTFPTVCANIKMNNTALQKAIKPYHIFEHFDVAIIGLTTNTTTTISNLDPGTTFTDHVQAMQHAIDEIHRTTNIKRIIAMTHIGYSFDKILAQQTQGLYMIVGGHSHTLLGNITGASGPYPTIETNLDGDEVFITQAYRWGEYLRYIDISFDHQGKVVAYEGAPIHMTNATGQDAKLEVQIKTWAQSFAAYESEVVGVSLVDLDQSTCQKMECTQGDVLADAMFEYARNQSLAPDLALINAGTIRSRIDAGDVTMGEILTSYLFRNAVTTLQLTGDVLNKVFEGIASATSVFNSEEVTSFVQVSANVEFVYDPTTAVRSRLVLLHVNGTTLDADTTYTVVTSDYVAGGGDNFVEEQAGFEVLDTLDEVFAAYIGVHTPVNVTLDGRISNGTTLSSREWRHSALFRKQL